MGNWFNEIYKYDISEIYPLNRWDSFTRLHAHELYTHILSEIGLAGFFSFIGAIFYSFKNMLTPKLFSDHKLPYLVALMGYLLASLVYASANMSDYYFSRIAIFGFISIGVCSYKTEEESEYYALKSFISLFSILAMLSSCWFMYSMIGWHQYSGLKKESSSCKELTVSLKNIHSPIFRSKVNSPISLKHEMANSLRACGEIEEASLYYNAALMSNPYNCKLLYDYAIFEFSDKENLLKSKELALRINNIQRTNSNTNLLLADLMLRYQDIDESFCYASMIYRPKLSEAEEYERLYFDITSSAIEMGRKELAFKSLQRINYNLLNKKLLKRYYFLKKTISELRNI